MFFEIFNDSLKIENWKQQIESKETKLIHRGSPRKSIAKLMFPYFERLFFHDNVSREIEHHLNDQKLGWTD